tara:strand:- start:215 stop:472 length:258 start_codon:yes stop_codon:yes gene_type:complete
VDIKLNSGDIVIDIITGDVGLLLRRYSLIGDEEAELNVWGWEIYWAGPDVANVAVSRYQPYTEEGILNLIKTGTFVLNKKGGLQL